MNLHHWKKDDADVNRVSYFLILSHFTWERLSRFLMPEKVFFHFTFLLFALNCFLLLCLFLFHN